jgi:hypothetical protein
MSLADSRWSPPVADRVRQKTRPAALERIDRHTADRVAAARLDGPRGRLRRLAELDREWNVDRALMANFAILGGLSGTMSLRRARQRRRGSGWTLLFFLQIFFLLHHAIKGWCPPLPVFRGLGFRTQQEIDAEREALRRLDA